MPGTYRSEDGIPGLETVPQGRSSAFRVLEENSEPENVQSQNFFSQGPRGFLGPERVSEFRLCFLIF